MARRRSKPSKTPENQDASESEGLVIKLQTPDSERSERLAEPSKVFDLMGKKEEPEPVGGGSEWGPFRERFVNIISKVLGDAQARRMVDRVTESSGVDPEQWVTTEELTEVSSAVLQKVPNRKIRASLEAETTSLIQSL